MRKVSEENYSSISHTSKNSEKEGEGARMRHRGGGG